MRFVWVLAALVACGGDDGPPVGFPDTGPVQCDLAPVLGDADEITVQSFPIAWEFDGTYSTGPSIPFQVAPDVTSVLVVVENGSEWTGLESAVQSHRQLIDFYADEYGETPPFFHTSWPVVGVAFPSDEDSALEPGCLDLKPLAEANLDGEEGTLHVLTRRRPAGGRIQLSLVQSGDVDLVGYTLEEIADEIDVVFRDVGLGSPDIELIDLVDGDPFVPTEGALTDDLRAGYVPDDPFRIIIYVIQGFSDDPFTLGFAGGIPGPNGVAGTAASGVLVAIDGHLDDAGELDVGVFAETAVHEVGHQIGLLHTSESDGDFHDPLEDTPECSASDDVDGDGEISAEECDALDGRNLMFWVTGDQPQRELSAWQRRLLQLSPVTR